MGQLPQQVVEDDDAPVGSGILVAVDPEVVVGPGGRWPSAPSRSVPRPHASERRMRSSITGSSGGPIPTRTSPARDRSRTLAAASVPSMTRAGRAFVPTMTGCTNSTARCQGVGRPPRRAAPQGGTPVEVSGQVEGGDGQVLGRSVGGRVGRAGGAEQAVVVSAEAAVVVTVPTPPWPALPWLARWSTVLSLPLLCWPLLGWRPRPPGPGTGPRRWGVRPGGSAPPVLQL